MTPAEIILANGRGVALVDPDDFERANACRWYLSTIQGGRYRYAQRISPVDKAARERLGPFILDCPPGLNVVYCDGNGLNCQRSNLLLATVAQRTARQSRQPASGYRGVQARASGRFQAVIWVDQRAFHLGAFGDAASAAKAYDAAAREAFGPHATLNFPDEAAA